MSNEIYQPYGQEWKEEINKMPKKAIIEMAAKIGMDRECLIGPAHYRVQCRNYLMGVDPEKLTVEDALENLGYGRNGLDF